MADPRTRSTALAPFQRCRDVLRRADARLSALLAAGTRESVARIERLSRLPTAAQFTPFDALSTQGAQADASDSKPTVQGFAGRPRRASRSAVALSAADGRPASTGTHLSAAGAGTTDFVREALASVPGASPGEVAELATGPSTAWAMQTDNPADASTHPDSRVAATLPAGQLDRATIAHAAGELIGELLQRHAAPRRPPRLQGIGARPAAAQALNGADEAAALQRAQPGEPPAATSPDTRRNASASWAQPSPADDARVYAPRHAVPEPPSSHRLRAAQMPLETGSAMNKRAQASLLQAGDDTLRALVTPLFLRPASGFDATANSTGSGAPRSADRLPVLRAPSRLLVSTNAGTAAAAPTTGAKAATAAPAFAATAPAVSMPADSATDLAAGLERLLREQAWLRGVDLT